jgi:hypothetical protein
MKRNCRNTSIKKSGCMNSWGAGEGRQPLTRCAGVGIGGWRWRWSRGGRGACWLRGTVRSPAAPGIDQPPAHRAHGPPPGSSRSPTMAAIPFSSGRTKIESISGMASAAKQGGSDGGPPRCSRMLVPPSAPLPSEKGSGRAADPCRRPLRERSRDEREGRATMGGLRGIGLGFPFGRRFSLAGRRLGRMNRARRLATGG